MASRRRERKGPAGASKGSPWILPVAIAAVVLLAVVWMRSGGGPPASAPASAARTPPPAPAPMAPPAPRMLDMPADLPPLQAVVGMSRPAAVVQAVYEFAARHPEVLQYVPCFCGCELQGHGANDDCFVSSRDASGRVTWDYHGMT